MASVCWKTECKGQMTICWIYDPSQHAEALPVVRSCISNNHWDIFMPYLDIGSFGSHTLQVPENCLNILNVINPAERTPHTHKTVVIYNTCYVQVYLDTENGLPFDTQSPL